MLYNFLLHYEAATARSTGPEGGEVQSAQQSVIPLSQIGQKIRLIITFVVITVTEPGRDSRHINSHGLKRL